jgi:signal transduction histidine kinase
MRNAIRIGFGLLLGLCLAGASFAADEAAIKANVDSVAEGINGGKDPSGYKAGDYDPYIFVMEADGGVIVHPSLQGESLNTEKFSPVYEALVKATPGGAWVEYEWQGSQKKSYVRETASGLIVGSGYTKE